MTIHLSGRNLCVEVLWREESARRTAHGHARQRFARVSQRNDLRHRSPQRQLNHSPIAKRPAQLDQLRPRSPLSPDLAEPVRPELEDVGHIRQRLDAVDRCRTPPQPALGRIRRFQPRHRSATLDRLQDHRLLAADIAARSPANLNAHVVQQSCGRRRRNRIRCRRGRPIGHPVDVPVRLRRPQHVAGDPNPFEDPLRVRFHQPAILERPRLSLLPVRDEQRSTIARGRLHRAAPLQMHRKIRAAATQQPRLLHQFQRLRRTQLRRRRPTAPARRIGRPTTRHPPQTARHGSPRSLKHRVIDRRFQPISPNHRDRAIRRRSTEEHALVRFALNLRLTRCDLARHPPTHPHRVGGQRTPAKLRVARRHREQLRPRHVDPLRYLFQRRVLEESKHLIDQMQRRQRLRPLTRQPRQRLLQLTQFHPAGRLGHHVDHTLPPIRSPPATRWIPF